MTDKGATKPEETQYEWQPANCVDPVCISEKIRHESGPFPFGRLERNQITRERELERESFMDRWREREMSNGRGSDSARRKTREIKGDNERK